MGEDPVREGPPNRRGQRLIPSSLIPQMATSADAALRIVLTNGATAFGQAPPRGEVGFVAAVVLEGVPAITRAWSPILRPYGYRVKVSGVFCHQSPEATFTDLSGVRAPCELADLLLVVDDLTAGATGRRWAALVQAKMAQTGGGKAITGTKDLRQLDLLTRWPPFTLSSSYQLGSRDFSTCSHGGAPGDCGRYGLIGRQPNPVWHQQAPAQTMPMGGYELGSFLAHMVESGQIGFGREATGTGDDWSRTVEELMQVTYTNLFSYVTGFGPNNPQLRGRTAMAFMTPELWPWPYYYLDHLTGEIKLPSGGRPDDPDEGVPGGGGISILRIGIARDLEG